jgi:hypothetical protein
MPYKVADYPEIEKSVYKDRMSTSKLYWFKKRNYSDEMISVALKSIGKWNLAKYYRGTIFRFSFSELEKINYNEIRELTISIKTQMEESLRRNDAKGFANPINAFNNKLEDE